MAVTETVKCSVVIALLLLVVTARGQSCYDSTCKLSKLFENALKNDPDNLWQLQQIYFNPDPKKKNWTGFIYLSVFSINGTFSRQDDCTNTAFYCCESNVTYDTDCSEWCSICCDSNYFSTSII